MRKEQYVLHNNVKHQNSSLIFKIQYTVCVHSHSNHVSSSHDCQDRLTPCSLMSWYLPCKVSAQYYLNKFYCRMTINTEPHVFKHFCWCLSVHTSGCCLCQYVIHLLNCFTVIMFFGITEFLTDPILAFELSIFIVLEDR